MPRLRKSPTERAEAYLMSRIKSGMVLYDVSNQELAAAARVCLSTLYSRYKKPSQFTFGELRAIAKTLHMPLCDLVCEETEKEKSQ